MYVCIHIHTGGASPVGQKAGMLPYFATHLIHTHYFIHILLLLSQARVHQFRPWPNAAEASAAPAAAAATKAKDGGEEQKEEPRNGSSGKV